MRGMLVEYSLSVPPLMLWFEFNPSSLTRTRMVTIETSQLPGARGGGDFTSPLETPRAARGASVKPETFELKILLDATDRMDAGDPLAAMLGVQPQIDTLRTMVEPKSQTPAGFQTLASLGAGSQRAFASAQSPSVLLFVWGTHILPIFLTQVKIDEQAHLTTLLPYRAEATLSMQVIESNNPFYQVEVARQVVGAAMNTVGTVASTLAGLF
ncbi:hypothetical protein ACNOYE_25720 [Nannocystaceae bacterium ST9]